MTTRDPATNPHVGDVWQDRLGITMTVTAMKFGRFVVPDVVVVSVDGWGRSFCQELDLGQFANLIRAGIWRPDPEPRDSGNP